MHKLSKIKQTLGFTLIELMVVIAIVAFVTAAVVPSFSLSLQRNRQREASMLIVQAVFAARGRAARTGRCHRIRIDFDDPGVEGGYGGMVTVEEYSERIECSNTTGGSGDWRTLSVKCVADNDDDDHAGLVGNDIAISDVLDSDCVSLGVNSVEVLFEPTGGLNITIPGNADERFFSIQAYTSGGDPVGVTRHVRLASGGAVKYTMCEP
ncbi:MAG: type II secretion system protein [Deltaproteobacteria bacterium]|nr:type II secretion system protein [Deltaproteobacteria bacterium]